MNHRLDPFSLPNGTDSRYQLLVITVLTAATIIFPLQMLFGIPLREEHGYFSILFAAVIVIMTPSIYRLYPLLKIVRGRLRRFTVRDSEEIYADLQRMCAEAGLTRPPVFLWNPLNMARTAVAFGIKRRRYLAFSGGLVVTYATDRSAFRAVFLHEMAHYRNGDVERTYRTMAVWWAFVVLSFVETTGSSFVDAWSFVERLCQMGVLLVLVFFMRNSVLRSREVYADLRAQTWDGPNGGLRAVLKSLPHNRSWRAWLHVHPSPEVRRQLLDAPQDMFEFSVWEAFGSGCAVGIALQSLTFVLGDFLPLGTLIVIFPIAILIPAAVAMKHISAGIWLQVWRDMLYGRSTRPTFHLGLALGLGVVAGLHFSYGTSLLRAASGIVGFGFAGRDLSWDLALMLVAVLLVGWLRIAARACLGGIRGSIWPSTAFKLSWMSVAGALSGAVTGLLLIAAVVATIPIPVTEYWIVVPSVLGMLGFPLVAYAWLRRSRESWKRMAPASAGAEPTLDSPAGPLGRARPWPTLAAPAVILLMVGLIVVLPRFPLVPPTPLVGDCVKEDADQGHQPEVVVLRTVSWASCDSPTALGKIIAVTDSRDNLGFNLQGFQPDCPDETDEVRTIGGPQQIACIRNLGPPHPGDPGMGGGIIRAGDCIDAKFLEVWVTEVPCSSSRYWRVADRTASPAGCPKGMIEWYTLNAESRPIACVDGGPNLVVAGDCILDPESFIPDIGVGSVTDVKKVRCGRPKCPVTMPGPDGTERPVPGMYYVCDEGPFPLTSHDDRVVARVAAPASCPSGTMPYDAVYPANGRGSPSPILCLQPE